MYTCNDCGHKFDELNENCCPQCGSGDYIVDTLEEVVSEADEQNKKGFAVALREFGEQYIQYKNSLDRAKECIKDTIEMAKDKGITKDMLLAYASAVQLEDFNAKVLCSAVQQELGLEEVEDEEQSDNQSNE